MIQEITNEDMEVAAAAADVYPVGNGWQVAVGEDGNEYGHAWQIPTNAEGIKL